VVQDVTVNKDLQNRVLVIATNFPSLRDITVAYRAYYGGQPNLPFPLASDIPKLTRLRLVGVPAESNTVLNFLAGYGPGLHYLSFQFTWWRGPEWARWATVIRTLAVEEVELDLRIDCWDGGEDTERILRNVVGNFGGQNPFDVAQMVTFRPHWLLAPM
jgi:hypothetical protein